MKHLYLRLAALFLHVKRDQLILVLGYDESIVNSF